MNIWITSFILVILLLISAFFSGSETGLMALEIIEEFFDKPISAIVVTGEKDPKILSEIEYTGCHYLPKPVNLMHLREKFDSVITNSSYK